MTNRLIGTKELRASLPKVVARVQKGDRYTVLYRSRPVLQLVPVTGADHLASVPLDEDSLYRADAVGSSTDGFCSADHDAILYGREG